MSAWRRWPAAMQRRQGSVGHVHLSGAGSGWSTYRQRDAVRQRRHGPQSSRVIWSAATRPPGRHGGGGTPRGRSPSTRAGHPGTPPPSAAGRGVVDHERGSVVERERAVVEVHRPDRGPHAATTTSSRAASSLVLVDTDAGGEQRVVARVRRETGDADVVSGHRPDAHVHAAARRLVEQVRISGRGPKYAFVTVEPPARPGYRQRE